MTIYIRFNNNLKIKPLATHIANIDMKSKWLNIFVEEQKK